jgi:hypothetical protein
MTLHTAEAAPAAAAVAERDVLIDRPDLGPGAATLIREGDPIPPHLADRPRRPAVPDAPAKSRRGA